MSAQSRQVRFAVAIAGLVAVAAAALGIGVRGTFGAHVAVDETQYLLTALSLAEDHNLDISDELGERRWAEFADVRPPEQTEVLVDGRQISPHDPLVPVLLALPMGIGGWVAAKAMLTVLAGMTAMLTVWLAIRRFAVPPTLATVGVAAVSASAPIAVYGQQVYPELPAALCVLLGVVAVTGARTPRKLLLLGAVITALPWLAVKYAPIAAVFAIVGLWRWWRAGQRRSAAAFVGGLAVMGAAYIAVHQAVWGGLTVYASGDHFQATGEFSVVGVDPNYLGRALRLVALLADREFGLIAWQPAWLLAVPAVVYLLVRRPPGTPVLLAPLATGWLVATFVALTMHGYWWPGRQLVVVLPLAVLVVLCWLADCGRLVRSIAGILAATGVITYVWLLVDGYAREITWVSDFADTGAVTYRMLRPVLPDYRGDYAAGHAAWIVVLAAICLTVVIMTRRRMSGRS